MRYWMALTFCRDNLEIGCWQTLSLDGIAQALNCTRRNAQLLIKRLEREGIIQWKSGVGRGNLPKVRLLHSVVTKIDAQAQKLMSGGNTEQALCLIPEQQRDQFIANFIAKFQTQPSSLDILQVPFYRATHDLDPIGISRRTEHHIAHYLYANLLSFDVKSGKIMPELAHTWQQKESSIVIILRKGLRFHDGSPILSHDVKAVYERLMNSQFLNRSLFQFIDDVIVLNDLTLEFFSQQLPTLIPKLLTHSAMGICKVTDEGRLVGSGSFMLKEQTEWRTLLLKFSDYYGYRPWIDGVEIWNIGACAKDFELNSDVVHGHVMIEGLNTTYHSKQQWEQGCIHVMLNPNRHTWMKLKKHRQELQRLLRAMEPPENTPDEKLGLATSMTSTPIEFSRDQTDAEQRNQLLVEGPEKPLHIMTYQLATHINTAKSMVQFLLSLGIACELSILEYPKFSQLENQLNADLIVTGEVFGEDTEMSWLGWLLCTTSNQACLSQPNQHWLKAEVIKAMGLDGLASRVSALSLIEKKLVKKGLYLPLYHVKQDLSVSDNITTTDLLANGWIDFNQVVMR